MTNIFGGYGGVRPGTPGGDYVSKAELNQKANRASGAKLGNIASLTSDGDLADSGLSAAVMATEEYVDNNVSMRLLKTGDAMSGKLNMTGRQIINLGDPEEDADACTRRYVKETASALKNYTDQVLQNSARFHFRLKVSLPAEGKPTRFGKLYINNTDNRFGLNSEAICVSITQVGGSFARFRYFRQLLDPNYLQLEFIFKPDGNPISVDLLCVVELVRFENYTLRF